MKSRILFQSIISVLVIATPVWIWAATGDTVTNSSWSTTQDTNILLLSGITVEDDMHILMNFTQNIVVESVRIRIAKQSDGTNIKIDSLTGVLNEPMKLSVSLSDLLDAGEAYTMTVISALSDKWVTITEGTDALSEFTAPDPLKQSLVVFNAAPEPTAPVEITKEEEATTVETPTEIAATTSTDETPIPVPENAELPLTGMNPLIFIIISGILALGLIIRKKS